MYRAVRNTHLLIGLSLLLFVVAYAASSATAVYRDWFPTDTGTSERMVAVELPGDAGPRELARSLMERHGVRGTLNRIRETRNGFVLVIGRPGTSAEVRYDRRAGRAHISTRRSDFVGMLEAVHFDTAGVGTGYWLQDLWGWFVVAVSLGLIVQGGSGIYLWFRVRAERRIGTILLVVGLAWGVGLIVLLAVA